MVTYSADRSTAALAVGWIPRLAGAVQGMSSTSFLLLIYLLLMLGFLGLLGLACMLDWL